MELTPLPLKNRDAGPRTPFSTTSKNRLEHSPQALQPKCLGISHSTTPLTSNANHKYRKQKITWIHQTNTPTQVHGYPFSHDIYKTWPSLAMTVRPCYSTNYAHHATTTSLTSTPHTLYGPSIFHPTPQTTFEIWANTYMEVDWINCCGNQSSNPCMPQSI